MTAMAKSGKGYAMRAWPRIGWLEDQVDHQNFDIEVEIKDEGYLARSEFITWLDYEGGLVCTCGYDSSKIPCFHGRALLKMSEAYEKASLQGETAVSRSASGLVAEIDDWTWALINSLPHEAIGDDKATGFNFGGSYVFPVAGGWGKIEKQAAQIFGAIRGKIKSQSNGRIWLPETALPDLLELTKSSKRVSFDNAIDKYIKFSKRPLTEYRHPNIKGTLDPAQLEGCHWLSDAFDYDIGGILADQMGVGKTLQIIGHMQSLKDRGKLVRGMVCAPSGGIDHWSKEFRRFAPDLEVLTWEGSQRKKLEPILDQADVVITTHKILTIDGPTFKKLDWTVFALDEAQDGNSSDSDLAVASATLPVKQKIPVTGSPVENSLLDLHTLSTLALPGLLGRSSHFRKDVSDPVRRGAENADFILDELYKVISHFLKHRTQDSAGLNIPAPNISQVDIALGKDLSAYEVVRDKTHLLLDGANTSVFHLITLLRQAAADYRLLSGSSEGEESTKTAWIADTISERISQGRQVLMFSTWTSHLDLIEKALVKRGISPEIIGRYDGSMNRRQKRWAEEDFKSGVSRVMQLTMKAGGRILNLPECDDVIIGVPWWNPAIMMQAAYRAVRRGQTKTIEVAIPIMTNTIEEKLMQIQSEKSRVSSSILRPSSGSGGLTHNQLRELVRAA